MTFIRASLEHLEDMCRITQQAKTQLKNMGLDQWQKGYPSKEVWEADIAANTAWLAIENDFVLGVFAFQTTPDVSYGEIDGAWLSDIPYASMHRVCVADESKGKGVAGAMFEFGFQIARELGFQSMRIDTHADNLPMQKALKKAGFLPCGTIKLVGGCEDGDERVAFEKLLND